MARTLYCEVPAIVDELLNILGVKSKRAPTGAHLDGRQVRSAFAGGVLYDPRDTDPQFLGHISRSDELADALATQRECCGHISLVASVYALHSYLTRWPFGHAYCLQQREDCVKRDTAIHVANTHACRFAHIF